MRQQLWQLKRSRRLADKCRAAYRLKAPCRGASDQQTCSPCEARHWPTSLRRCPSTAAGQGGAGAGEGPATGSGAELRHPLPPATVAHPMQAREPRPPCSPHRFNGKIHHPPPDKHGERPANSLSISRASRFGAPHGLRHSSGTVATRTNQRLPGWPCLPCGGQRPAPLARTSCRAGCFPGPRSD